MIAIILLVILLFIPNLLVNFVIFNAFYFHVPYSILDAKIPKNTPPIIPISIITQIIINLL